MPKQPNVFLTIPNHFHFILKAIGDPQGSRSDHSCLFQREVVQPFQSIINFSLSHQPLQEFFCTLVSQDRYTARIYSLIDPRINSFVPRARMKIISAIIFPNISVNSVVSGIPV